jgi:hypothetical protein
MSVEIGALTASWCPTGVARPFLSLSIDLDGGPGVIRRIQQIGHLAYEGGPGWPIVLERRVKGKGNLIAGEDGIAL